jgi:hypothetical protein
MAGKVTTGQAQRRRAGKRGHDEQADVDAPGERRREEDALEVRRTRSG